MKLGELLLSKGIINKSQLQEALHKQQESTIVYNKPIVLGKVLVELGYIEEKKLIEILKK